MKKGLHRSCFFDFQFQDTGDQSRLLPGKKNWNQEKKKVSVCQSVRSTVWIAVQILAREEFVRDMFVNEESLPDVLVCMDEVVTERVCWSIITRLEMSR